jgi:uncharacterized membrane protein YhhN
MPDWLNPLFLAAILVFSLVNWSASWRENFKLYYASKPFVLLILILFFVFNGGLSPNGIPFLIGLVFSLIGDILLISKSKGFFILGMGAFAIVQFAYIWGFNQSLPSLVIMVVAIVAYLIGVLLFNLIFDRFAPATGKLSKSFIRLMKAYFTVVFAMAISAVLSLARPDWSDSAAMMAGLGGILFLFSDLMIGLDKLGGHLPKHKFWIIITYHIGQFLIVAGVLLRG